MLEGSYPSLTASEEAGARLMGSAEWERRYARFSALVESGYREILGEVDVRPLLGREVDGALTPGP